MSSTLETARRLRKLGFSLIPLDHPDDPIANDPKQRGKTPALKWAPFMKTPATDDNLQSWFGNGKARNIGIITGAPSGLVVVDTDTHEAELAAAEQLPRTPMQVITAKGRHRYYRYPGVPVPNGARIRPGVDLRGDGGYVVGPGSQHASGHIYRAPEPWPDSLDLVPVFDLAWLGLDAPRAPRWTAPATRGPLPDRDRVLTRARAYVAKVPGAIEGQGGDAHTFQLSCKLVRGFGLDPTAVRELLRDWNRTCVPPWSDRELEAKIESALRYGREPIGAKAVDRPRLPGDATRQVTTSCNLGSEAPSGSVFAPSDTGNTEAFTAWYGDRVRYDWRRARFLVWQGHRWVPDADAEVERLAKETIRRRQAEAFALSEPDQRKAALKWALTSESRQRRDALLVLARSERPIADKGEAWDRTPLLLCASNGVIDLHTGTLRDGHPDDRITMATAVPYDPAASCPLSWPSSPKTKASAG